jgi:hypothetical protein
MVSTNLTAGIGASPYDLLVYWSTVHTDVQIGSQGLGGAAERWYKTMDHTWSCPPQHCFPPKMAIFSLAATEIAIFFQNRSGSGDHILLLQKCLRFLTSHCKSISGAIIKHLFHDQMVHLNNVWNFAWPYILACISLFQFVKCWPYSHLRGLITFCNVASPNLV